MIKVQNIIVNKGKKQILNGVSLEIKPGTISVVIGKNGAGKSTLLETITGTNTIHSGTILWNNIPFQSLNSKKLSHRRAVLSQLVKTNFAISVADLVEMGTYASDEAIPKVKIQTLIQHALEEVEMLDFGDRDFNTLSGGEQKRVLLAKCIVQLNCSNWANVNKYLFLDEPTANLDIQQQYKLIKLVKKLVLRRNVGVLAILHDINLAAQFADEIIILKAGKILEKGSPWEVIRPETLTTAFDIHAIIQKHPVFNCPHITPLPDSTKIAQKQKLINS